MIVTSRASNRPSPFLHPYFSQTKPTTPAYRPLAIRFGKAGQAKFESILFVTPECKLNHHGGLGGVSESIPNSFNQDNRCEMLTIIPGAKDIVANPKINLDSLEYTGVSFQVISPFGGKETIIVLREKAHAKRLILTSPKIKEIANFYSYGSDAPGSAIFLHQALTLFARGVSGLLPYLDPNNKDGLRNKDGQPYLKKPVDAVISNDWPMGYVNAYLPKGVARIFMLHNENDSGLSLEEARDGKLFASVEKDMSYFSPLSLGINSSHAVIANHNYAQSVVERLSRQKDNPIAMTLKEKLEAGHVADMHHESSMTYYPVDNTILRENASQGFTPLLPKPSKAGHTVKKTVVIPGSQIRYKMSVSPDKRATQNNSIMGRFRAWRLKMYTQLGNWFKARTWLPSLNRKIGYWFHDCAKSLQNKINALNTPNAVVSVPDIIQEIDILLSASNFAMHDFKQKNKRAVQQRYGLTQDDQAVIFTWMARIDPNQKGFYKWDIITDFLRKNPKAQLLIAGEGSDDKTRAVMAGIRFLAEHDTSLQNRVKVLGKIGLDQAVPLMAGSTFMLMPSFYEPFGLSQLEAMLMGTIPIVHPVDGLASSVYDEYFSTRKKPDLKLANATFGPTGIYMKPIDNVELTQRATRTMTTVILVDVVEKILASGATLPPLLQSEWNHLLTYCVKDAINLEFKGANLEASSSALSFQEQLAEVQTPEALNQLIRRTVVFPREAESALMDKVNAYRPDLIKNKIIPLLKSVSDPQERSAWESARKSMLDAMDVAMRKATKHPEQIVAMAVNAQQYVLNEHSWPNIRARYEAAFNVAHQQKTKEEAVAA